MTAAEWDGQWTRLAQFRVGGDAEREQVSAEWFAQLKHHHVDAVDHGITHLIGSAKDTFLPGLGLLKDLIQQRLGRYDKTDGKCETCHGSKWIEAQPWKSNRMVYTGFQRCPDCGTPAPEYKPLGNRESLSAVEYQAWRDGTFQEPPMYLTSANASALEALKYLNPRRGRMAKAIEGAPKAEGVA
jgi:hypothetical protein